MENSAKTTKKECHNPRAGKPPSGQALFYFTPLAPCGGETRRRRTRRHPERISIHSPLVGARRLLIKHGGKVRIISIHSPRVGARRPAPLGTGLCHNFNPLAPCGGETVCGNIGGLDSGISIHSPRVGARHQLLHRGDRRGSISIHSPRVGARRVNGQIAGNMITFQSTRPVWGRDRGEFRARNGTNRFQSTRPVWGRDAEAVSLLRDVFDFNPLAPCGGETSTVILLFPVNRFQSTRPVWGRDQVFHLPALYRGISIHSPRVGARPGGNSIGQARPLISIHSPRVGARLPFLQGRLRNADFNPLAPCGGETPCERQYIV